MDLNQKVEYAKNILRLTNDKFKKPVIMCSFGKDSMVLLHLCRSMDFKWPVLFHREPFMPHKYRFANQIIDDWNLTVYDYRPSAVSIMKKGHTMEIVNEYQIGTQTCVVPTGICSIEGEKEFICGLEDLLCKPTGTFNYPWDICLIGHKATDIDPIQGQLGFELDFKMNVGSAHAAFPIRQFTDEDIWEYTLKHSVPIHTERYEKVALGWIEKEDKSSNPDYFPICNKCFDSNQPFSVQCPKHGKLMNNISGQVRVFEPKFDYINPKK